MHVVRELVHHDHDDAAEGQPAARPGAEDQLDDLAIVEVATDEFAVGLELFQRGYGEVVRCQDRVADGSDAGEESLRLVGIGAGEGLDEDDAVCGRQVAGIEAEDVERHSAWLFRCNRKSSPRRSQTR